MKILYLNLILVVLLSSVATIAFSFSQRQESGQHKHPRPRMMGAEHGHSPFHRHSGQDAGVGDWSHWQDSSAIDITGINLERRDVDCAAYAGSYTADATDHRTGRHYTARLVVEADSGVCRFTTNVIPNHDFNDSTGRQPHNTRPQSKTYTINRYPRLNDETVPLSLELDNAIMLNGVKVDLLAAACFGVSNGHHGCFDISHPWRYDPMGESHMFALDSHNAHTQRNGAYHYHGSPMALFDSRGESVSPVVGYAADGFPIYGPYIDEGGTVRRVEPSYRLKEGRRPSGNGNPGGRYDGTFTGDYEYVAGIGDLDECNGMVSAEGTYGYYITDTYPYILNCFRGEPNRSFSKSGRRR